VGGEGTEEYGEPCSGTRNVFSAQWDGEMCESIFDANIRFQNVDCNRNKEKLIA
jgi:hypothetical protein